jgi:hypothetical protein
VFDFSWLCRRLTQPELCAGRRLALALVHTLGELLDDLLVEGIKVVGLTAAHQALVDVDFLVDPLGSGVAQVGLKAASI